MCVAPKVQLIGNSCAPATINAVILPNAGTYVIGGQQLFSNLDPKVMAYMHCHLVSSWDVNTILMNGAPLSNGDLSPEGEVTLPLNGYFVATQAPTTLYLECAYSGADNGEFASQVVASQYGSLTAIQVK